MPTKMIYLHLKSLSVPQIHEVYHVLDGLSHFLQKCRHFLILLVNLLINLNRPPEIQVNPDKKKKNWYKS